eukprot:scaffold669331_cov57-Prasinocladus_malaysianus.AAC.1
MWADDPFWCVPTRCLYLTASYCITTHQSDVQAIRAFALIGNPQLAVATHTGLCSCAMELPHPSLQAILD